MGVARHRGLLLLRCNRGVGTPLDSAARVWESQFSFTRHDPTTRLNQSMPDDSRREFLRFGLSAFGSLSLPALYRLRAAAAPEGAGERTAVIIVWLRGGCSHLDTYDPKPDAPAEYRGPFGDHRDPNAGPAVHASSCRGTRRSPTASPILRSMAHTGGGHPAGSLQLLSGDPDAQDKLKPDLPRPDERRPLPAVRPAAAPLPNYVGVNPIIRYDNFTIAGPAYLGEAYAPFAVTGDPNAPDFRVPNIGLADPGEASRLRRRGRACSRSFDDAPPRPRPTRAAVEAMDAFEAQAHQPADQPRGGAGVRPEPGETPRSATATAATPWGQQCLMARRLVEAGVEIVTTELRRPALRPGGELGRPRRQPPRLRRPEVPRRRTSTRRSRP